MGKFIVQYLKNQRGLADLAHSSECLPSLVSWMMKSYKYYKKTIKEYKRLVKKYYDIKNPTLESIDDLQKQFDYAKNQEWFYDCMFLKSQYNYCNVLHPDNSLC